MTRKEIMDMVVELTDEDTSIYPVLGNALNEALRYIALNGVCPIMREITVTPSTRLNRVALQLPVDFFKFFDGGIYDALGKKVVVSAKHAGYVYLDTSALDDVTMIYASVPDRMTQDNDIPPIPDYLHEALAVYAAYSYLMSIRKETRAMYLLQRFNTLVNVMGAEDREEEVVINPYG